MSALHPLEIKYVSPSAIETYLSCPHRWALTKIDRHPKEQSAAAALGSAMHAAKEAWLRDAIPYDLTTRAGVLAQSTMHLDPAPGVGTIENEMTFEYEGITFGGKLDLHWLEKPTDVAIVQDHKRTANRQYAKLTKASLLDHPQLPIYVVYASRLYGTPWVHARWNYVEDGGPASKARPKPIASWHAVHVDEAIATMPRWVAAAREMHEYVRRANDEGLRARDVPKNTASCYQFGKCQFLKNGQCCPSPPQELIAIMTQQAGPSFAELLAAHQAQQANTAPQNVQQTLPQQSFIAPTAQPAFLLQPAAPPQFIQQPVQQQVQAPPLQGVVPINYPPPPVEAHHYGAQINPPEASLPPAPVAPLVAPTEEKPKRGRGRPAGTTTTEVHVSALEGQAIMTIVALVLSEVGSALIRCSTAAEQLAKGK